ncbi:MAG TPA: AmmeMemoRadiSam system protein B, partial [Bacteroidales bacterium]|nr:AmmeMemoRadiSam system protein B [Bacteroidales bacterium]
MIILALFSGNSRAQDHGGKTNNRKAYAAGKFYSGDGPGLRKDLENLFSRAVEKKFDNVQAVIVPHAGYPYSGIVAASGYNQVDPEKDYEYIFIIASSHTAYYRGASIYNQGNYETPLGEVAVDTDMADMLIEKHDIFSFQPKAHMTEHSLEVQLPFLQYIIQKPFKIVPIVIGTQEPSACREIATALKPYFNERNLFVVSTDFSHYPEYNDACKIDELTADAVLTNSASDFLATLRSNEAKGISNLATAMCGWSSVLTLLELTGGDPAFSYSKVMYRNSGDSDYFPDKSRVVGYYSIALTSKAGTENKTELKDESQFSLTDKDKADLLGIARLTMEEYISKGGKPSLKIENFSETLKTPCGAFVTLLKDGELRGCIGTFNPSEPLYDVVQQMAIAASTRDHRFSRVDEGEFDKIEVEISVLTPMRKI